MKSTIKLATLALTFLATAAFTSIKNDGLNITYGVSADDPSQIELQLNKDYTFAYQDLSNASRTIAVKGTYQVKGNNIVLNSDDDTKYHNKWKMENNGVSIKSKKGLTFYTLQKK